MGQKENTFVVIIDIAKLPFLGHLHANTNIKLICEDLDFKHVTLGLHLPTLQLLFFFSFTGSSCLSIFPYEVWNQLI